MVIYKHIHLPKLGQYWVFFCSSDETFSLFVFFKYWWNVIFFFSSMKGIGIFAFLSVYVLLVLTGTFSTANKESHTCLIKMRIYGLKIEMSRVGGGESGSELRPRKCHFETRAFSLHFSLLLGCFILRFHEMVPSNSRLISLKFQIQEKKECFFVVTSE